MTKKPKRRRKNAGVSRNPAKRCGLCGATRNLTKTQCCGNWICDDVDSYQIFSYARNSCYRNHDHYTICSYHHAEGHTGDWKECDICRADFEPEMYAHFATNEYNFEVIDNPPDFEPHKCIRCGATIVIKEGGYSMGPDGYTCFGCTSKEFKGLLGQ